MCLAGCSRGITHSTQPHGAGTPSLPSTADSTRRAALSAAELMRLHPNEAGQVPILEYHAIDTGSTTMSRTPDEMRHDLQRLYDEGYRPVSLQDYLAHRINIPAGKSPVILTFDDARPTQFHYTSEGILDPECAVGILQAFHQQHPDFSLAATFFVLPTTSGFGSPADRKKKMKALLQMGFEIGNHTLTHRSLRSLTDAEVQGELAGCLRAIHQMVPEAKVDTLALPLGIHARHRELEAQGESQGQIYAHQAVLLVGANPAPSPVSTAFDPMRLPRIQACEGDCGLTYWLNALKKHPEKRYISDGDPNTVTVPRSLQKRVNPTNLHGSPLRIYDQ